jgi:hypothetical protein
MEEPVAMARLAWGASAPVSEPAFEVNHHTAEASTRRRPGVLVGRCLVRRRQIDPELHHLEVSALGCRDRSVSQWVCDGAVGRLEHSDDRNYCCGDDYYNCEKNIQQINRGGVIYVVFDGGPLLSTSIRSPTSAPKHKIDSKQALSLRELIAKAFDR